MTQLAKIGPQENAVAEVRDLNGGLLEVIARAACDPNVDIDKMERLLAMQERVHARGTKADYAAALAEMQPELPAVAERGGIKDRNGNVQSTYALWEDINAAIKPILSRHGFALSFKTNRAPDHISVTGILSHRSGHSEETTLALPVDTSGSKNAVQAVGSSVSYGKRYTAQALLNLTSYGEDDDGHAAGLERTIDDKQLADIERLAEETGTDKRRFCTYMKVESLKDIPASEYHRAIEALNRKQSKKAGE